jgi:hypothetical protein
MMRVVAALLALWVLGPRAAAEPSDIVIREAKRRFQRANQLYQDGRYSDALHLYQAAYDLVPSADILFNIALTKEKVSDFEGCSVDLAQYLRESDDIARKQQAQRRLEACRAKALVPVKVSSLPASAAIFVGEGESRVLKGRTPTRLELLPGAYLLTIEAPGYVPQTQRLTVEVGVHPDVDFTLDKLSTLHIEADVSNADIEIDGKPEGTTPLQREIKPGVHTLRIAKAGHRPVTREVRIHPGDQLSLDVALPLLPRLIALTSARPVRAEVAIDGMAMGVLPLERALPSGRHHVEVTSLGHLTYAGDLFVPDDRDLTLRVMLTPHRSRLSHAVFWSIEALAAAAALIGVGFGAQALVDQSAFDEKPTVPLQEAGRLHAAIADGALISAAVLALGGGIYYLATMPRRSRVEAVR